MPVLVTSYVRHDYADSPGYAAVSGVATSLLDHLNTPDAQDLLALANLPGQSSAMVQASFNVFATELGFVDESRGLFEGYKNRAVRPDYFRRMGDTGILMEGERGKTTINQVVTY